MTRFLIAAALIALATPADARHHHHHHRPVVHKTRIATPLPRPRPYSADELYMKTTLDWVFGSPQKRINDAFAAIGEPNEPR